MKTNQSGLQPTVLPWHREAAKELYAMNRGWSATYEDFETVIARHDPHAAQHIENVQMSELWAQNELLLQRNAGTLRLLELTEARLRGVNDAFNSAGNDFMAERCAEYANEIRAHLATHSKPDGKKGSQ